MTDLELDMIEARMTSLIGLDIWADGDEVSQQFHDDIGKLLFEIERLRRLEATFLKEGRPTH